MQLALLFVLSVEKLSQPFSYIYFVASKQCSGSVTFREGSESLDE
jgi:hypothetical protein